MRTTIVPAQITTVEDKIAGNLTMTQIFLLLIPIFAGSIIYFMLPPHLHFASYKLFLLLIVLVTCSTFAIRIKGKILLRWFVILLVFNNRPRYFIADKNDDYHRDIPLQITAKKQTAKKTPTQKIGTTKLLPQLAIAEVIQLEQIIHNPKANLRVRFAKKGDMYVSLTEIEK